MKKQVKWIGTEAHFGFGIHSWSELEPLFQFVNGLRQAAYNKYA